MNSPELSAEDAKILYFNAWMDEITLDIETACKERQCSVKFEGVPTEVVEIFKNLNYKIQLRGDDEITIKWY